jgi:hypothetical protein
MVDDACGDCGCGRGEFHELFCTKERCPFCEGQLASCECIHSVIGLSEEESKAVDEYVDDWAEPLKSIMARWKSALDAERRIPW